MSEEKQLQEFIELNEIKTVWNMLDDDHFSRSEFDLIILDHTKGEERLRVDYMALKDSCKFMAVGGLKDYPDVDKFWSEVKNNHEHVEIDGTRGIGILNINCC